jgi:hypothetical protein
MSATTLPRPVRNAPAWFLHEQAAQESRDGHFRHVVYSPRSGPTVLNNRQAFAFIRHVHVDATYLDGVLIASAGVRA